MSDNENSGGKGSRRRPTNEEVYRNNYDRVFGKDSQDMTEWKPIPGYEDCYEVSNDGQVKSLERTAWNGHAYYKLRERILKSRERSGYLSVNLNNGKSRTFMIHRLVAESFVDGRTEERNQVNHINGIKTDNRACNLEWCSHKDNMKHAIDTGLMNNNGENSGNAKLNQEEVNEIRLAYAKGGITHEELSNKYGVKRKAIGNIINNKTYCDRYRPVDKKKFDENYERIFRKDTEEFIARTMADISMQAAIKGMQIGIKRRKNNDTDAK